MLNVSPKYPLESPRIDFGFRPAVVSPPAGSSQVLSAAAITQFNELGFTPPLPVFEGAALRRLQREWRARASDVPRPAGEPFRAYHPEDRDMFNVISHPTTVAALQQLLGSAIVVCHISQFVSKPPLAATDGVATGQQPQFGQSAEVFHQDAGFNAMDARCVVAWLAIEDADTDNGCMHGIPTSHVRCGGLAPCDDAHNVLDPAQFGGPRPLPAPAGSVIFLSDLLMHSSPLNPSPQRSRPAITATYAGAELCPLRGVDGPDPRRFAVLVSGCDAHSNWGPLPPPLPTVPASQHSGSVDRLRVMTFNIHHGEGMDSPAVDLAAIAAVITQAAPDLVALQEVDRGCARTEGLDMAWLLGQLTGMDHVFGSNVELPGLPGAAGEYGNAILSRWPIRAWVNHSLPPCASEETEPRGLLLATVEVAADHDRHDRDGDGGGEAHGSTAQLLRFACTHLDHTSEEQRSHSVQTLGQLLGLGSDDDSAVPPLPTVLAGDFNARPAAAELCALRSEGFVDAWEASGCALDDDGGPGVGAGAAAGKADTYSVDGFTIPSVPTPHARIDYLWLLGGEGWHWERSWVVPTRASDHLPVVAELCCPRGELADAVAGGLGSSSCAAML